MSFQENIWLMIKQSMGIAKRKANASGKMKYVMTLDKESEDLNYNIEWLKIIIQGPKDLEQEEYDEALKMYSPLNKIFKKEMPKDDNMKKHFRSKIMSSHKVEEAYKQGYGSMNDNNMANKLLEMGILTHVEKTDDYDTREEVFFT